MKAHIFPGQGSQFPGMAKDLYNSSSQARNTLEQANEILGFRLTDVMFEGSNEDLKQTKATQPSLFCHSIALIRANQEQFEPRMVAGHSLGEFSALVANGALSFENGLQLVSKRAQAMQKACEAQPSTMAAVMGLDDEEVERICEEMDQIVVPANYNSPGQLVISGTHEGVEAACQKLQEAGAKMTKTLNVGGAFHSPLMEPARQELEQAIHNVEIHEPSCPVYQNVSAQAENDPSKIKQNLIEQLTSPVKWTQTVRQMLHDDADTFIEVGPGDVLRKLVKKIDRQANRQTLEETL